MPNHKFELFDVLPWLPLPVFVLLILHVFPFSIPFSPVSIRLPMNIFFGTLESLLISYLFARSFLTNSSPGLLLLGCGVFLWGASGIIAHVFGYDVNANVTVHNVCVWASAVCHLTGVALTFGRRQPLRHPGLWLGSAYLSAAAFLSLIVLGVRAGWAPAFFLQGQGGTSLRQLLLGSSVVMLTATAISLRISNPKSRFAYWYSLSLVFFSVGLTCAMLESSFNDVLSWICLISQWIGGAYMLIAGIVSMRNTSVWGIDLAVALKEARQQFELLFDLAADGIFVHEPKEESSGGKIIQANLAFCNLIGYTSAEVESLSVSALMTAPSPTETVPPPEEKSRIIRNETALITKSRRIVPVEISTRIFRQGSRELAMSIVRDMTKQKANQEALKESMSKLALSNAELAGFCHVASHDLKEPLQKIEAYLRLLEERFHGSLDENLEEDLCTAIVDAKKMRKLVDDLLIYSTSGKQLRSPIAEVNCNGVIQDVLNNLKVRIEECGAEFLFAALPVIQGDRWLLVQLFQHLIDNALKYRLPGILPQIRISVEIAGTAWLFRVRDNGIGFNMEFAERIFDPFLRVHGSDYPGSGIGLATCKKIVERHGGKIWVESHPRKGSTFFFTFAKNQDENDAVQQTWRGPKGPSPRHPSS